MKGNTTNSSDCPNAYSTGTTVGLTFIVLLFTAWVITYMVETRKEKRATKIRQSELALARLREIARDRQAREELKRKIDKVSETINNSNETINSISTDNSGIYNNRVITLM